MKSTTQINTQRPMGSSKSGIHAICIGANIVQPSKYYSIQLKFVDPQYGDIFIKYFNTFKKKSNNFSVPHNGDFAKLYRITFGEDPVARYSKVQQLMNHFIGHEFFIDYVIASFSGGQEYQKVKNIHPVSPINNTGEWTNTGIRIPKPKKPIKRTGKGLDKIQIKTGQRQEINKKLDSDEVEKTEQNIGKPHKAPSPIKLGSKACFESQVTSIRETVKTDTDFLDRGRSWIQVPGETIDTYHERILDGTL